jgi:hypothetical protein
VEFITKAILAAPDDDPLHSASHPKDPTDEIVAVLHEFNEWYITIRSPRIRESQLKTLDEDGRRLMESLKRVFPNKSWKFGKFHAILHVVLNILLFGWSENTSGQWGEHGHTALCKRMSRLTNNKDIFLQIGRWHERAGQLQEVQLAQEWAASAGLDGADAQVDDLCANPSPSKRARIEQTGNGAAVGPGRLAMHYPLMLAAESHQELQYLCTSRGRRAGGRYSFDVWSLPENRVPRLRLVAEHLVMTRIPELLGIFAYEFMGPSLGLRSLSAGGNPSVQEVHDVLRQLVPDRSGRHIHTFGCLQISLEKFSGSQRIRSYPFGRGDEFHGKNRRPTVFVVPPQQFRYGRVPKHKFTIRGIQDVGKLWLGRVELLFSCSFLAADGREVDCDLALISFLYRFRLDAAYGPCQRSGGAPLYYEPEIPWIRVVPVRLIVGRAPLQRSYPAGGVTGTIPNCYRMHKMAAFRHGKADSNGGALGSALYELNIYAWRFGRPMETARRAANGSHHPSGT